MTIRCFFFHVSKLPLNKDHSKYRLHFVWIFFRLYFKSYCSKLANLFILYVCISYSCTDWPHAINRALVCCAQPQNGIICLNYEIMTNHIWSLYVTGGGSEASASSLSAMTLPEFLAEAELSHYLSALKNELKVTCVEHLKVWIQIFMYRSFIHFSLFPIVCPYKPLNIKPVQLLFIYFVYW